MLEAFLFFVLYEITGNCKYAQGYARSTVIISFSW